MYGEVLPVEATAATVMSFPRDYNIKNLDYIYVSTTKVTYRERLFKCTNIVILLTLLQYQLISIYIFNGSIKVLDSHYNLNLIININNYIFTYNISYLLEMIFLYYWANKLKVCFKYRDKVSFKIQDH